MKFFKKIIYFFILWPLTGMADGIDLESFVYYSVNKSDSVAELFIQVERAEDKTTEKKATFLPSLNASLNSSRTGNGNQATVISSSTVIPGSTVTNTKLNLSQNIFNGFKDSANLSAAEAELRQNKFNLVESKRAQVEEALLNFFTLLQYNSERENILKEIDYNNKSLVRSKKNSSIGATRKTEAINLEATIANNKIDLASTEDSLQAEKNKALHSLRLEEGEVILNYPKLKFDPKEIDSVIAKLDPEERSDFKAQKENTEVQKNNLKSTKSTRLPVVDLDAAYVMTDNSPTGSQKDQYQVGLTLTIPFPGFEKKAQVDQAAKTASLAEQQERHKLRDLQIEKAQLIRKLKTDVEQIKRLAEAKKIGSSNVDAIKQEHQAGLSSYSDLLSAFSNFQQIVRKYEKALLEYELDCYRALIWSADEKKIWDVIAGVNNEK